MRRMIPWLALTAILVPGCSEPLPDDKANDILSSCCNSARERVTSIKDVESNRFRDYCLACRRGNSKADCAHGAGRALRAVAQAYSADLLPLECNTLHTQLKELGIEIKKPQ